MEGKYRAVLFSLDGGYITDFIGKKTKKEVQDCINSMGSRWFYYPLWTIGTDKTIVETPEGFSELKNKRILTVKKYIQENTDEVQTKLGIPFEGN